MKITQRNFIKAVAATMKEDPTNTLVKEDGKMFDVFSVFALNLLCVLENEDINEKDFACAVNDVIIKATEEMRYTDHLGITCLALISFSVRIWNNLKPLQKCEKCTSIRL